MMPRTTHPPQAVSSAAGSFSVAEVSRLFGLPEHRLRYWSQTGFLPASGRRSGRLAYTFRDLIAIKVAKELLEAGLPLRRVRRSLDALRLKLPTESTPLSQLRICCEDDRVVVSDREHRFEAVSGQLLLDFDVASLGAQVENVLSLPWLEDGVQPEHRTAYEWFLYASSLDRGQPNARAQAQAAYEHAVALDPELSAAWTNLGGLLAEAGDFVGARDMLEQALRCDPEQTEAQVNLAELALRDGDLEVAMAGFRQVLRTAPEYFEAHYGLARALLKVGGKGQAVAHLERFCRAVESLAADERDSSLEARWHQARETVAQLRGSASD